MSPFLQEEEGEAGADMGLPRLRRQATASSAAGAGAGGGADDDEAKGEKFEHYIVFSFKKERQAGKQEVFPHPCDQVAAQQRH